MGKNKQGLPSSKGTDKELVAKSIELNNKIGRVLTKLYFELQKTDLKDLSEDLSYVSAYVFESQEVVRELGNRTGQLQILRDLLEEIKKEHQKIVDELELIDTDDERTKPGRKLRILSGRLISLLTVQSLIQIKIQSLEGK